MWMNSKQFNYAHNTDIDVSPICNEFCIYVYEYN